MTAIGYPDLVAWAPRRTFRCEARSPYNLPEWHPDRRVSETEEIWPNAFQEDFEFTLYQGESDRVVWTVRQTELGIDSPHELYVSDSGTCVVRTHGFASAALVVLGPRGERRLTLDLLTEVFVGPWADRVSHSTAGPFWSSGSHAYFAELDGREHLCVRTWWGGRILIDIERARLVDAEASGPALAKIESTWAIETLRAGAERVASWQEFPAATERAEVWDERALLREVESAIVASGRLMVTDAERFLRVLQATSFKTSLSMSVHPFQGVRPRFGTTWGVVTRGVRLLAATALRRLGRVPEGLAPYVFVQLGDQWQEVPLEVAELSRNRDTRVRELTMDQTAIQVLEGVGTPDFMEIPTRWDYDLDADETVRLELDRTTGRVSSITRTRPAGWHSDVRDRAVFH